LGDAAPILRVDDLTRRFEGLVAVAGLSFEVRPGQIKALIGPNGSGKSTTLNVISGLLAPTRGRVFAQGQDVTGWPPHRVAALGVGRTFQNLRLFRDLSVLDNVMLGSHRRTRASIWDNAVLTARLRADERFAREAALAQLEFVGLVHRAAERADSLSFGQQRQVELARALAQDPAILLLDEPASGLNAAEADRFAELILQVSARGAAILLVEHNVGLVMDVSDEIVVLNYGRKIAEGTPDLIQADLGVRAAYLGEEDAVA
jgi:ABC-type branched-subunit amino acid transport system ATPase component